MNSEKLNFNLIYIHRYGFVTYCLLNYLSKYIYESVTLIPQSLPIDTNCLTIQRFSNPHLHEGTTARLDNILYSSAPRNIHLHHSNINYSTGCHFHLR